MRRIAIIPARGGSKRIPRKNTKLFFGKPIVAYSIQAAINSGLYDEVMVSTDDEEIAAIARQYGAQVPFMRSDENSNDFATTVDVLLEVLDWYASQGQEFHQGTCIYACAPFVSSRLLTDSFALLEKENGDCVFPSLAYSHPIQRALKVASNGKIELFDPLSSNTRTQDLERAYFDAGMFYTFDVSKLKQTKSLRTQNTFTIEVDDLLAQDIDNENDWKLAEMKYQLFFK
ncbi:pseudaminic acid cytidylyltransferase [Flavobacterium sp. CYK-4]|uniref:pseudaminic acid cytidylyltransferase n=1 Tax=Flavobacterium lotistagni TaxID=2709660 RepID=UPI00140742F9|nr:pseudaminic acid cytidylyltransferase [Flavobacterium lotistagni]NHM06457.1 pseudaminic acid cytidylyltransferase [Flavobacterium lotistagni]